MGDLAGRLREAHADLDAVRAALGNGADEAAWPPGMTVAQAVAKMAARAYRAEETCALLYGDVDAQHRVISDACAVLGVCEDSEDDWPKLPTYVVQVRDEAKALRAERASLLADVAALEAGAAAQAAALAVARAELAAERGAAGLPRWVWLSNARAWQREDGAAKCWPEEDDAGATVGWVWALRCEPNVVRSAFGALAAMRAADKEAP